MLPGQVGELDAETVRVDLQPLVIGPREFHHEVVRDQGPALGHDRGPVVHLPLHGACDLHRLQLGLERPREGTLNHALEPLLEAL